MIPFLFIFSSVGHVGFLDNEAVVPLSLLPFVLKTFNQLLDAVLWFIGKDVPNLELCDGNLVRATIHVSTRDGFPKRGLAHVQKLEIFVKTPTAVTFRDVSMHRINRGNLICRNSPEFVGNHAKYLRGYDRQIRCVLPYGQLLVSSFDVFAITHGLQTRILE